MDKALQTLLVLCAVIWSTSYPRVDATTPPNVMILYSTPDQVTRGLTRGNYFQCDVSILEGNLLWLRILKKSQSQWTVAAEMNQACNKSTEIELANNQNRSTIVEPRSRHRIWRDRGGTRKASLTLRWETATRDVFGTYICEALFDSPLTGLSIQKTENMIFKETITPEILLQVWEDIDAEYKSHPSCIGGNASGSITSVKAKVFGRILNEYFEEATREWPKGNYALLMPESGCPDDSFDGTSSYLKFHQESSGVCHNNTQTTHLGLHLNTVEMANCYLNLAFCVPKERGNEDAEWPEGNYCINKLHSPACPRGFHQGLLKLDQEDKSSGSLHKLVGAVPWYDDHTNLDFCCKTSSDPSATRMKLPTTKPFYLYRYSNKCQEVVGMNVEDEYIEIDTEDYSNADRKDQVTPDIDLDKTGKVRIRLCYYWKKD